MLFYKGFFLGVALLGARVCPVWASPELILTFPAPAEQTAESQEIGAFALASGPFVAGKSAMVRGMGQLRQVAWRLAIARPSTKDLMRDLARQSAGAGYRPIYDCWDDICGGFDFRFNISTLSEPALHVDLGDFRYLLAQRSGQAGPEYLSLLVSRNAEAGFVQLSHAITLTQARATTPGAKRPNADRSQDDPQSALAQALTAAQPVVLEDLVFSAGAADLEAGDYSSLRDLAQWLQADRKRRITLIGHSDATGRLAANIALSKQRAASVRAMLLKTFDLREEQIDFDGVGPAAPRASESTPAGRAQNRRVEVVVAPER